MKNLKGILLLLILAFTTSMQAQNMTNDKLEKIIYVLADTIIGDFGNWQFLIEDRLFVCITDENNNRMRIMTPIIEQKELSAEDMIKVMEANFHTALDARYALSNELLWSCFIHPLKELGKEEVISAISQVRMAALTYGTTYTSSELAFPDGGKEKEEKKKTKKM